MRRPAVGLLLALLAAVVAAAPSPVLDHGPYPEAEDPCGALDSCGRCVEDARCGWCAASGRCEPGGPAGDKMRRCASWNYALCPAAACKDYPSCTACLGDPYCGWCGETESCVAGNTAGPLLLSSQQLTSPVEDVDPLKLARLDGSEESPEVAGATEDVQPAPACTDGQKWLYSPFLPGTRSQNAASSVARHVAYVREFCALGGKPVLAPEPPPPEPPKPNDPHVMSVKPRRGGQGGSTVLTIAGEWFGPAEANATAYVGGLPCAQTIWTTPSILKCVTPPGEGDTEWPVVVSVEGRWSNVSVNASSPEARDTTFTYLPLRIDAVEPSHAPTNGGTVLHIKGGFFGTRHMGAVVSLGQRRCLETVWETATLIKCVTPPGYGTGHVVRLDFLNQTQLNLGEHKFDYDAPRFDALVPSHAPTTGGTVLSIRGANFGTEDIPLEADISGVPCAKLAWVSHGELHCTTLPGLGAGRRVNVRLAGRRPAQPIVFDYDPPIISKLSRTHGSTFGTYLLVISGSDFGTVAAVGDDDGADSALLQLGGGRRARGSDNSASASARMARLRSTAAALEADDELLMYDPQLLDAAPRLVAPPSSALLQMMAPAADDGVASVLSAAMKSASTLSSGTGGTGSTGPAASAQADSGLETTLAGLDPAVMSPEADSTGPTGGMVELLDATGASGGASTGPQDGMEDMAPPTPNCAAGQWEDSTVFGYSCLHARVNNVSCIQTLYYSSGSIGCVVPPGVGGRLNVTVHVGARVSVPTAASLFSYNAPVVTRVEPFTGPAAGNITVALRGTNFGTTDTQPVASVGGVQCLRTVWVADNLVECVLPPGVGAGHSVRVDVGGQLSGSNDWFNYQPPIVYSAYPDHGPTNGGYTIRIAGRNFGTRRQKAAVAIGGRPCAWVRWQADDELLCGAPEGHGRDLDITVTLDGQARTIAGRFSYDPPTVTAIAPQTCACTGGCRVALTGTNFGHEHGKHIAVHFDGEPCTEPRWGDHDSLSCVVPPGVGSPRVVVTINRQSSPADVRDLFAYHPPRVFTVTPHHAPPRGGDWLNVTGICFGGRPHDRLNITLGGHACAQTVWLSNTAARCRTAAGSGQNLTVSVVARGAAAGAAPPGEGTPPPQFYYDPPLLRGVKLAGDSPAGGGAVVTVTGSNLPRDAQLLFGGMVPPDPLLVPLGTTWQSWDELVAHTPAGVGRGHIVQLLVDGVRYVQGSLADAFASPPTPATPTTQSFGAPEGGSVTIRCPGGSRIRQLLFASYGTPDGFTNHYQPGACHADARRRIEPGCVGRTQCVVPATNSWFGDPCRGVAKRLRVTVACGPTLAAVAERASVCASGSAAAAAVAAKGDEPARPAAPAEVVSLQCPPHSVLREVLFADWGDASGSCARFKPDSKCSTDVRATVDRLCLGRNGCRLTPSEATLGPPAAGCAGRRPKLRVRARCSVPGTLQCVTATQGTWATVRCPAGSVVTDVTFASYGKLGGGCGSMHHHCARDRRAWFRSRCLMRQSCNSFAQDWWHGDPCYGHRKYFRAQAICAPAPPPAAAEAALLQVGERVSVGDGAAAALPGQPSATAPAVAGSGPPSFLLGYDVNGTLVFKQPLAQGALVSPKAAYKPPAVTRVLNKARVLGGSVIHIVGNNFGRKPYEGLVVMVDVRANKAGRGWQQCKAATWQSETAISCTAPAGVGGPNRVRVIVGAQSSKVVRALYYEAPRVLRATPEEIPRRGGATVTLHGLNFGTAASTITVTIGGQPCTAVRWLSNKAISCRSPPGGPAYQEVRVTVEGQTGRNVKAVRYAKPVIHSFSPQYAHPGDTVRVLGVNFGPTRGAPLTLKAGPWFASVQFVSDGEVRFRMPNDGGHGGPRAVRLQSMGEWDVLPRGSAGKIMYWKRDCIMGGWGHWHGCDRWCGWGTSRRYRGVARHPAYHGRACASSVDHRRCVTRWCPENCHLSGWHGGHCHAGCWRWGHYHRWRHVTRWQRYGGHCHFHRHEWHRCYRHCWRWRWWRRWW